MRTATLNMVHTANGSAIRSGTLGFAPLAAVLCPAMAIVHRCGYPTGVEGYWRVPAPASFTAVRRRCGASHRIAPTTSSSMTLGTSVSLMGWYLFGRSSWVRSAVVPGLVGNMTREALQAPYEHSHCSLRSRVVWWALPCSHGPWLAVLACTSLPTHIRDALLICPAG